jgi:hypothetical protein
LQRNGEELPHTEKTSRVAPEVKVGQNLASVTRLKPSTF